MKKFAVAMLFCGMCLGQTKAKPTYASSPTFTCTAGPDEKCPDAQDYARAKAILEKYKVPAMTPDDRDLYMGIMVHMNNSAPKGMQVDINKAVYVKMPEIPAVIPTKPEEKK